MSRRTADRQARGIAVILAVMGWLWFLIPACPEAQGASVEWREEVALHDGGTVLVNGWMQFVASEPFQTMPAARRLSFEHPGTGQRIVWENAGKIGSRVNPKLLDFDGGRPFLVASAQAGPDYDGFGCPTPPYIVFRFDGMQWIRVSLADLPQRFERMNLYPDPDVDELKAQNYFISAAVTARSYKRSFAPGDEYKLRATVDRRIRNPLALGCRRPDAAYGAGSYARMRGTGNWLNKTEAEALKLLWGDREGAKP